MAITNRSLVLAAAASVAMWADESKQLGTPLTLDAPVTIQQALTDASSNVGKTVQVKGKVTEVCQMMGCWMALADPSDSSKTIRIQVKDGDIVFPKDSVGKIAIAEGVLTKHELTRAQTVAKAKHEAEEQGRKFNPDSIKQGVTYYEISGTGAVFTE